MAGLQISVLGGSRAQIGGPNGALIIMVAGLIATHALSGHVTATFMAGAILVAAVVIRAGRIIALVPEPMNNGFTLGIAAIIAASQIKDLLGMDLAQESAGFPERIPALWAARGTVSFGALWRWGWRRWR
jgi:SulP family sulfate permease